MTNQKAVSANHLLRSNFTNTVFDLLPDSIVTQITDSNPVMCMYFDVPIFYFIFAATACFRCRACVPRQVRHSGMSIN